MGEGGFLDLLDAVAACSDVAHDFVMESYPDFERYYRKPLKIFSIIYYIYKCLIIMIWAAVGFKREYEVLVDSYIIMNKPSDPGYFLSSRTCSFKKLS